MPYACDACVAPMPEPPILSGPVYCDECGPLVDQLFDEPLAGDVVHLRRAAREATLAGDHARLVAEHLRKADAKVSAFLGDEIHIALGCGEHLDASVRWCTEQADRIIATRLAALAEENA